MGFKTIINNNNNNYNNNNNITIQVVYLSLTRTEKLHRGKEP